MSFPELAKAVCSQMGRLPADAREELEVTKIYDPVFGTTSSATHIAAVEIDPPTCKVTIDRYVVAENCGRIINPMIVRWTGARQGRASDQRRTLRKDRL